MHASEDIKESMRRHLEVLIRASGASLLKRMPNEAYAESSSAPGKVVVLHEEEEHGGRNPAIDNCRHTHVQHLSYRWLIESAGTSHVQGTGKFKM